MMKQLIASDAHPMDVVRRLDALGEQDFVFFDSGSLACDRDCWSILCCRPQDIMVCGSDTQARLRSGPVVDDILAWLKHTQRKHLRNLENSEEIPFSGGLAGFFGFEFAWNLDRILEAPHAVHTPNLWVGDFPCAALYNHRHCQWYITGDLTHESARFLESLISSSVSSEPTVRTSESPGTDFRLTISEDAYKKRVSDCIDAIYRGELFEVNYTERFEGKWIAGAIELYQAMRATSTGMYGGMIVTEDFQIASISPEQFLEVKEGRVITRPIKGTRKRDEDRERDQALALELLSSEKDRAENVMIVDLMRNDLTRVCELGTVEATEICALKSYGGVHHLVSTVEGKLDKKFDAMDAFWGCFPAGSITGAPKLRSIELISQVEHSARGPYTGSMFYWSGCGRLDSNVLIRTAVLSDGVVQYGAGGAVVADSIPEHEYEEAWVKARPICEVFGYRRREQ